LEAAVQRRRPGIAIMIERHRVDPSKLPSSLIPVAAQWGGLGARPNEFFQALWFGDAARRNILQTCL